MRRALKIFWEIITMGAPGCAAVNCDCWWHRRRDNDEIMPQYIRWFLAVELFLLAVAIGLVVVWAR
jgi:hypothetical protein